MSIWSSIGSAIKGAVSGLAGGPFGAILGAATGFLGNEGAKADSKEQQERNFQYAKQLAQYQADLQREQFDYTNLYNDPYHQVKRLENANLNPNLVYGSGNVVGNTAGMPSVSSPHMNQADPMSLPQYQLQLAQMYKDIQLQSAQIGKVKEETRGVALDNKKKTEESPWWTPNAILDNALRSNQNNILIQNHDINSVQQVMNSLRHDIMKTFIYGSQYDPTLPVNSKENKYAVLIDDLKNSPVGEGLLYELKKSDYERQEFDKRLRILQGEVERLPDLAMKYHGDALVSKFKGELAEQGINADDPLWMRVIAIALSRVFDLNLFDMIKGAASYVNP